MGRALRCVIFAGVVLATASAVGFGLDGLLRYESTAGEVGNAPSTLPSEDRIASGATLVMALHPKCPCSRATVGELARIMAKCDGRLKVRVLMYRPKDAKAGWERTDLWESAAAIPGVTVAVDEDGSEARQFGALTSGQVMLYGTDGRLMFSGGITEGRGHAGDNAGESAVVSLVNGKGGSAPKTPVYGCAIFSDGGNTCRK